MAQITYTNKVALNENPEIANINKVTDDDMNEIKQVVNDNYNNTIQITSTQPTDSDNKIWIDTGEIGSAVSEVINSLSGNQTNLAPSVMAVNERLTGTVLFESTTGTNQSLLLNDSLNNYKYIDFIYGNSTKDEQYVKRVAQSSGRVLLNFGAIGDKLYMNYTQINYNNLEVSPIRFCNVEIGTDTISSNTITNFTYITKIIGYK